MNLRCENGSNFIKCERNTSKYAQNPRNHRKIAVCLFFSFSDFFDHGPWNEGSPRGRQFEYRPISRSLLFRQWVENVIYDFQFCVQVKTSCSNQITENCRFWPISQTRSAFKKQKSHFSSKIWRSIGRDTENALFCIKIIHISLFKPIKMSQKVCFCAEIGYPSTPTPNTRIFPTPVKCLV